MNPLGAVEDILRANVYTWPSYVLFNIFVKIPCPQSIKKVAAFMCGNGIPLDTAIECFTACSGKNQSLITETMTRWYSIWNYSSSDCHPFARRASKAEYYSVFHKKWLKINGQPVIPEITVMQFGVDATEQPQMIAERIEHVRTCNAW